jgi:kexin
MGSVRFRRLLWVCLIAALVACCSSTSPGPSVHRQPERRSYATHAYYVLEVAPGTDEQAVANELGAVVVEPVGELRNHWLLSAPRPPDRLRPRHIGTRGDDESLVEQLAERDVVLERFADWRSRPIHARSSLVSSVISLERQVTRKRAKRFLELDPESSPSLSRRAPPADRPSRFLTAIARRFSIVDPLFYKQWHIANDDVHENSVNVTGVWAAGVTGKGVRVAIVDDGLDSKSHLLVDKGHELMIC